MSLVPLQPGDTVELIAPAARCSPDLLKSVAGFLKSWGLKCYYPDDIFNFDSDLLCANTDKMRFEHLKHALFNPDTQAIWGLLGGYGSMRLIPELMKLTSPSESKLLIGFSDITALHLFCNQHWNWPTIHAPSARQIPLESVDKVSIMAMQAMLLKGTLPNIQDLICLNNAAKQCQTIHAPIVGGNLCMVACSLGTSWQIDAQDKIVLLEDVNERAYCVDRSLMHLQQAGVFEQAQAILLGDFIGGDEKDGSNQVDKVLQQFAEELDIPVFHSQQIGHGTRNLPVWLNQAVTLQPQKTQGTATLVQA